MAGWTERRVRRTGALMAAAILAAQVTVVASAGGESLPRAREVLERHVQASGGRAALKRHKSMTVHARFQNPSLHLDVEVVSYGSDGKTLQVAQLPGGKSLSGYDGHTAWDLDSHGKVTIYHGDEVRSIARDADMYYHLRVMDYFKSLEVVGVEDFEGRPCYHLLGVNNWGQKNEQFYDKETGLLRGYRFNTAWRGGAGDATALFEDYRDFGGVLMATKSTSREAGSVSVFLITSVTWDDVPEATFELPAEVRAALAH